MRWDKLFSDLEAEALEIARTERDVLAADLHDELWAATGWGDLLGGHVVLDVRGVGQVGGQVIGRTDHLVRLRADRAEHVVACRAVRSVVAAERRADPVDRLDAALGWSTILRRWRDAGASVRVVLDDGSSVDGAIEVVGRDFVRLGATRVLVLDAISLASAT